jgi:hypothetical protein
MADVAAQRRLIIKLQTRSYRVAEAASNPRSGRNAARPCYLDITPRSLDEHIERPSGAAWKAVGCKILRATRAVGADFDGFEVLGLAGTPHLHGIELEHPNLRSAVRVCSSLRELIE